MQGHCGQVVAQVGRYWQPAPDPVLPVLTPVGTPTCIPEMLTKAIKYGHRAFPPDLVRSLPPDILNAYLRIVRCVLTPTDVRWIYNDVRRSRADWPVTVPTPSAEYNGLVASPMSPCQQQQQSVPTLTYYICSTGQSNDARATLNGAARALLGYTNDDLQSRSTVHQESMLGMFLPNFWKLFHPVSWRDIAHHFIRCWVQGCTTMHFARLVYVAKNGTLVEARSQWRSELTAEDPDESATDSDDSVALPTRMTRQVLIMEFDPL
ncbi:PAS domain-containing protein [Plasmodiophora brassicae]